MFVRTPSEFGPCPCGGTFDPRHVEVRMTVEDSLVVLSGVPQGACPVCGSRVYKAAELLAIESVMKGWRLPSPAVFPG
jgi:YgiT-type zinc finger domain-containing protein